MIPHEYVCSGCQETFAFKHRSACYYVGQDPLGPTVEDADLLSVLARPAWCNRCKGLCLAEDLVSLRDMENAYGAVRRGQAIEYPIQSSGWDAADAEREVGRYLRWRMDRRHIARALCCGGSSFQFLDVAQPLIKHAECEFGFIEGRDLISSYNGPGPGVYSSADMPVYSTEGELVASLTWRKRGEWTWQVEPISYLPSIEADLD